MLTHLGCLNWPGGSSQLWVGHKPGQLRKYDESLLQSPGLGEDPALQESNDMILVTVRAQASYTIDLFM